MTARKEEDHFLYDVLADLADMRAELASLREENKRIKKAFNALAGKVRSLDEKKSHNGPSYVEDLTWGNIQRITGRIGHVDGDFFSIQTPDKRGSVLKKQAYESNHNDVPVDDIKPGLKGQFVIADYVDVEPLVQVKCILDEISEDRSRFRIKWRGKWGTLFSAGVTNSAVIFEEVGLDEVPVTTNQNGYRVHDLPTGTVVVLTVCRHVLNQTNIEEWRIENE